MIPQFSLVARPTAEMFGYIWPESSDCGTYITNQLDANLEVVSTLDNLQPKPCVLQIAGHVAKRPSRDQILTDFFKYVHANPEIMCVIIWTGWETDPVKWNNTQVYRFLPTMPSNCFVFTCNLLLNDMQIASVRGILESN